VRRGVAIAGTGFFAEVHAETLGRQDRLALAGFFGARPGAARDIAAKFGVAAYAGIAEALADDAVAAVIVATPHATHLPIGEAVLASGRSVLIEKPLADTLAGCDALIAAQAASSGKAMVGHLMRWSPAHLQARDLIEAGAIGEIVSAESRRIIPWNPDQRRDWHKSAAEGGGMWLVQGVHVIDQLTFLIGARADRAVGLSRTRFHPEQSADDFGLALLGFGAIDAAITIAGTPPRGPQLYTELVGRKGSIRVSHRGELLVDTGAGWENRLAPVEDPIRDMLDAEMAAFADLLDGRPVPTDLSYGRYVVSVVEAVRRSMASGRWEGLA
jgi:predicted dehydrogenase